MLKSVDILIGLSVVMLVVSMAVTVVTQAVINAAGSRGRNLLAGLVDLLEQLDSGFGRKHVEEIVKMILTHPTINGGKVLGFVRYGEVIHREELTKMLLELAVKSDTPNQAFTEIQQEAMKALKNAMAANGITNPGQTLDDVRMLALQMEKSNPEMANNVRYNIALMHQASSQFLAKINLRFDPIIDRVSERFTFNARILTFVSAAVVAVALQLDTVTLVNRLAMDDSMRSAFVHEAMAIQAEQSSKEQPDKKVPLTQNEVAEQPANKVPLTEKEIKEKQEQSFYSFLASQGVITPPTTIAQWSANWHNVNYPGVAVSILLLSLGAPFWYSAVGKLLQLRSLLAQKDDAQRVIRQTTQILGELSQGGTALLVPPPVTISSTALKATDSVAQEADSANAKMDQMFNK